MTTRPHAVLCPAWSMPASYGFAAVEATGPCTCDDPPATADEHDEEARLAPHVARLDRDAHRLTREHGMPRMSLRIIVPADWPDRYDGVTLLGMPVVRAAATGPRTVSVPIVGILPSEYPS